MRLFLKHFNLFHRDIWLHPRYVSSLALALHPPFSGNPNAALFSRNLDPPLSCSTPGTASELIQQANREQLAPFVYSVHNMLEVNAELKQLVKQGQLCKARNMFEKMDHRDEISWTTLIGGYVNASDSYEALFLFSNMWVQPELQIDQFMISVALKACALGVNICLGELLHGFSVKSGLITSVFVSSALIDMYMKVGKIEEGCRVFETMMAKNVVSWTAFIAGLVHAGYSVEGLLYFSEMWRSKVGYDSHTFSIALKASADLSFLHHGKAIHTQTIKQGFDESSFVINTLATMYNKCGKPDYVMRLFEKMRMPDVVSWTNLITTYVQMGEEEHAMEVFKRMRKSDVPPNKFTFAAIISACANLAIAKWGEQLHGHVFRLGFVDALSVANSIITLYSKCGLLTSASLVFRGITRKDIISWSTIIAVYSQGGYAKEAFDYLSWMRREGPKPNEFAISSILSVCASMALLEQGKQVHAHVLCIGIDHEAMVHSALISMYSKCGSVQDASKIFDSLKMNDIISWTAMINGYAEHGYSLEAINLFEKISIVGLKPDHVTFIGVLTACSHAGMVDLGLFYFLKMTNEYKISPSKEHYGCIIDLLCRAGQLSEAEHIIRTMPFHIDDVVWSTFLRACREHGDVDRGRWTAEQLLRLDPNSAGTHITLANIYAAKGRWKEVADIRKLMKSKGVIKERGWSWINVNDHLNAFVAGDQAHPQSEHISTILELLRANIGDAQLEIRSLHEDVEV
ncbi:putative pentatricopeptide repeat-containing protein At3g47840 [Vigna unguiculata]|uniref:putative pentatricopeptide repeat-containing protein At3g47840 n=1 Tax=Vigna unguiculata TaxID=3917 RepID=UPI00101615EA|nr:putative pentatricopeptide repeat-containing protein At3g47840 [Vigna unguiculata]XP_027907384.1 putative pentatricopeptide repeat-containing protein At3g47840 [Vigna unguiculata]XP_027907385.1 putative pentatricopeptide repeat-containing protein At3g47840 [Vigna unguiculata]XP_027907386.1 putative pentatricopeptide repeat-containing protein At3g47840 [Vigna unguiculata]